MKGKKWTGQNVKIEQRRERERKDRVHLAYMLDIDEKGVRGDQDSNNCILLHEQYFNREFLFVFGGSMWSVRYEYQSMYCTCTLLLHRMERMRSAFV